MDTMGNPTDSRTAPTDVRCSCGIVHQARAWSRAASVLCCKVCICGLEVKA